MGPFKNEVTRVRRDERGYPKLVTKNDIKGGGVQANSDITTKKIMYKFLFFVCFSLVKQQLSFGYHSVGGVVSSIGLSPDVQAK